MQYRIEITAPDFKSIEHEEAVASDKLKDRLQQLVPECNIDFKKVFTDDRCRYFHHYMPVNKTVAKHAYKENNQLFKSGSQVRVYISKQLNTA